MKKILIISLILLISIPLFIGCSPESPTSPGITSSFSTPGSATPVSGQSGVSSPQPQYGGHMKWIHTGGMPILGHAIDGVFGTRNTRPALEGLLLSDEQDRIHPWLAESWDVSPDGKVITLHLRKGIKFHDGTDFNAQAVKYNVDQTVEKNVPGSAAFTNVKSIQIPDDYTIVFTLDKYDYAFLLRLAQGFLIGSPTALSKPTTPENTAKDHLIGTGPFKFDSWSVEQFARFTKFSNYWQKGKPYVDSVEVRTTPDITVAIMSFKAKEVNFVDVLDPSDAVALAKEGYEIYLPPLFFVHVIIPDSANPQSPFADKRVREALEYALNREAMAQTIGKGYMFPAYQIATKGDPWEQTGLPVRQYNPSKAKQLLAEAGYPNGFKTTIVSDVRIRRDQLVAVQTYLKEVGIDASIDMADVPRFNSLTQSGWSGLLMPGFPVGSTLMGIVGHFNDTVFTYPSRKQFEGYKDKWDAVFRQTDYEQMITQLKANLKIEIEEALITPYIYDQPRCVIDDKLQDMNWTKRHTFDYWSPADLWLKQK